MTDPTIPGLEVPGMPEATGREGPMVASARTTLEALAGNLEPRHAVLVQLVLSLAGAIDRGVVSGRASAVAMAAKQLLETMLVLDPPPEGPTDSDARAALDAFVAFVEKAANESEAATP